MHVVYGNYVHDAHEATLRVIPEFQHSELGHKVSAEYQFLIDGRMTASTRTELLAKFYEMEAAYLQDGKDLKLIYSAPHSGTVLHYRSNQSLTGIVVKRPPTSVGIMGAEYACQITYQIVLAATYVNNNLASDFVVSFNSGLRQTGRGGALFVHVPAKQGLWRKQDATTTSPVKLLQFGELTGLRAYPRQAVPAPLFPSDLLEDQYEYEEVRAAQGRQTSYTIRYAYAFERNRAFF